VGKSPGILPEGDRRGLTCPPQIGPGCINAFYIELRRREAGLQPLTCSPETPLFRRREFRRNSYGLQTPCKKRPFWG